MAFVFREDKLKKLRPNTALGPGEYLPQSDSKILKNNDKRVPFDSGVKKFKPLYGELNAIRNATPGPGKYYIDDLKVKTKRMENLANIKLSNYQDIDNINNNNIKSQFDLIPQKEKLGFDVKAKRFKNQIISNPGPGQYFQKNKNKKNEEYKSRVRSALFLNNEYIPKKNGVIVPSIPYKDNGFEIGENDSLIKLESQKDIWKKNKGKLGPGSYDIDNPKSWLKSGTSWSKMKVERGKNISNFQKSNKTTRPESALDLNINIIPVHNNNENIEQKLKKRAKSGNHLSIYYQMMKDSSEEKKLTKLQLINNKNSEQIPGPGYYIDIQKNSTFYHSTQHLPEYKQFFLSNNERFPELKQNEFLGPTTYFQNNKYFNSTFSSGNAQKNTDINKIKKTPFSSREKRFKNYNNNKNKFAKTPGPGSYDPKLISSIDSNKFNNSTNTFNFRAKRFGTTCSDIKWKMSTPGPGSYINPYSATGTSNTLLINGLYLDIKKGKELLRNKSKETKSINNNYRLNKNNNPGVGLYNPGLITSISYNNKRKVKSYNGNINVAFSSRIKDEENRKDFKSNIGPGTYYKDKPLKQMQINPPFHDSEIKLKSKQKMFGIGPGYYESRSYFDWNKKSYNSTFY